MCTKLQNVVSLAVLALFFVFSTHPATSEARNCTKSERDAADAKLKAIQGDKDLSEKLIRYHMPYGVHNGTHAVQGGPDNEDVLVQGGYVLRHDKDLRTGLWVSYKLTDKDIANAYDADGKKKDRVNCFRQDPRMGESETAIKSNYDEPIFDRGHLANDADIKDDLTEQINTYVLSNMSPQYCRFNRGIWLSLEELGRMWAEEYETVYITSGAIFDFNKRDARDRDESVARMGSRNQKARVAIPSAYYKIFLRQDGEQWHSAAFLLEHNHAKNGVSWGEVRSVAEASIVRLEDIEKVAETTFHPNLDRDKVVQHSVGSGWDLSKGGSNSEKSCR